MDKENVVFTHREVLLCHKEGQTWSFVGKLTPTYLDWFDELLHKMLHEHHYKIISKLT